MSWLAAILLLIESLRAIKLTIRYKTIVNLVSTTAGLAIANTAGHDVLIHGPTCGCAGCLPPAEAFFVPAAAMAANLPHKNAANVKEQRDI